eukprot:4352265-Prymnesium_polylepis.1
MSPGGPVQARLGLGLALGRRADVDLRGRAMAARERGRPRSIPTAAGGARKQKWHAAGRGSSKWISKQSLLSQVLEAAHRLGVSAENSSSAMQAAARMLRARTPAHRGGGLAKWA